MKHWLDGSGILNACSCIARKIKKSVQSSRLLQRKERTFSSALADRIDRLGIARFVQRQIASSRLLSWLYHYWDHLCAARQGRFAPSMAVYLGICALLGVASGFCFGIAYGLLIGVAAVLLPALFRLPPFWAVCLLCGGLPLLPTAACAALSVGIVGLYFFARAFGAEQGKPCDKIDLLLALFPLLCIGSAVFSYDRADSFMVLGMWMSLYLCIFVVRRVINSRGRLVAALSALTIGACAGGLIGVVQFLSGQVDTTWTDVELFQSLDLRVFSTFENPNVYGEYLLLVLPLVAGLAMYTQGRWRRILWAAEGLLLLNLILTYSRGCYVGLLLTALVFLWKIHKRWAIASLALGVPIALLVLPQSVLDRIGSIGNFNDGSTAFRIYIYIGVAAMLAVHWLGGIGIGEGAFSKVYPRYAIPEIDAPHSHSLIFQTLISFGVAGLIYLFAVLASFGKAVGRAQKAAAGKERWLPLGFGSVLWGFLMQSFFDYTWYNYRVFQLFWIVLALGFAAAEQAKGDSE